MILYRFFMPMFSLQFFAYFSYLFLLLSFWVGILSIFIAGGDISGFYYALFAILLLPLIDALVSSLWDDEKPVLSQKVFFHDAIFASIFILGCGMLWLSGQDNPLIYLLFFALIVLLASWEARIFFIGAIILLCYVTFSLLVWLETQAEQLSLYLYYMLILGVVWQILQQFRFFTA